MGETPENPSIKWGNDRPFSKWVKKSWLSLKLLFDCDNDSYEAIPCSNDENCPYCRLKVWDVWKLINKNWWKVILEADDVVDDEDGELEFLDSKPIIRIFHSGSGWWFIADDWTIVHGDYIKMNLYALEVNNYQYTIAKWETLENWHEKIWYFSLKDWFKSDDLESLKNKCIEENPYHNNEKGNSKKEKVKEFKEKVKSTIKETGEGIKKIFDKFADLYVDEQYNMRLRRKFSLKQWTKQWYSFMKNWKVWIMWILEPKYEDVAPCSDNYIWVKIWEKRWLLDADGNIVIEPKYDKIYEDGRVTVKNEYRFSNYRCFLSHMWLIDIKTGREIIDPNKNEYSSIKYPFKWYSVVIAEYSGKYGLISTIDWRIIKDFDYKSYRIDRKNKKLSLYKDRNNVEVFDCSPYKEAA